MISASRLKASGPGSVQASAAGSGSACVAGSGAVQEPSVKLRPAIIHAARRLLRILGLLLLSLTALALLGALYGWTWLQSNVLSQLPEDLSSFRDFRPLTSCRVFASDGSLIDEFYLERRVWVDIDELPDHVWQAFVAAEDRRFFEHEGVDLPGIARAIVVNLQAGHIEQGGSTLTQQLVKNLLVGKEKSYTRKLKEAVLAWRLEEELDKREILELYLNYVALGSGNYGVEAAARDYFGFSARNLDAGQAALLAGLVPAPSRYSPRANPELAASRRALVLRLMVAEGMLSAEAAALLQDAPVLNPRDGRGVDRPAVAYATEVRREIRRLFGDQAPFSVGLQVHTPVDLALQQVAEASIRTALHDHLARAGAAAITGHLEPAEWPAFLERGGDLAQDPEGHRAIPPEPGQCFRVLVGEGGLDELRAGPWTGRASEAARAALIRATEEEQPPRPLAEVAAPGDVVRVCLDADGAASLSSQPWAEGAAVVLENRTGRVRAIVGGYQDTLEGFVRATQARRQPGSSFKPYVYAAALLNGHTQRDTVIDGPIALPAGGGGVWSPSNYDEKYEGALPMRRALARSLNTVAVRLILETGAAEVSRLAARMGVRTPIRSDLTIALGSSEVTPMDQALGYATIARGGVTTEPVWIESVADADGRPLGEAGDTLRVGGAVAALPGGAGTRALPAGVAYELADMLREVVRAGTARRAWVDGHDRAGKTGTTNGFQDAWFIGFTPSHTVAVWIGTDGTTTLGDKETGGKAALPAWVRIVEALPDDGGERLPVPPDVVFQPLDGQWVAVPRAAQPATWPERVPLPAR